MQSRVRGEGGAGTHLSDAQTFLRREESWVAADWVVVQLAGVKDNGAPSTKYWQKGGLCSLKRLIN